MCLYRDAQASAPDLVAGVLDTCRGAVAKLQRKGWNRAKKEALADSNFEALTLAAKKKDWQSYRKRRQRS